ncbi:MAG: hypothetical protein U0441_32285 [Polyangiaceae bacterium]
MLRSICLSAVVLVAASALTATARAEDKASDPATKGAQTTETLHIKGRVARPQVVTEVARLTPAQHLAEMRSPLLDRIEKAIDKSPF